MKLNRKLVLFLSLVLSLALATGGTLAYLSDTDADVNTMTLGNVQIEQLEYERVTEDGHELTNDSWVSTNEEDKYGYTPDKIQEYTQNKPLYPAVFADGAIDWDGRGPGHQQSWGQINAPGSNQLFDDSVKNTVDKFVFVKNTGKSDAYVRTWFAFEQGSLSDEEYEKLIGTNADADHWFWKTIATNVELAGPDGAKSTYVIACATYLGPTSNPTGILKPGDVTYPSLLQVYMHPEATNKDVENVDGNKSGRYDIIVVTQAIQAAGFDNATDALNEGFGTEHPFVVDENENDYKDAMDDAYAEKPDIDHWDGTVDTTWYNDNDTEFVLTTAEQLAGFGKLVDDGNTFAGKTVKLDIDLCLGCGEEDGCEKNQQFNPIGHSSNGKSFDGTFDGQDHTIANLYKQNNLEVWQYEGEYYALFAYTNNATIKNLTMEDTYISSGRNEGACIAGNAVDTTFENIDIKGAKVIIYNNSGAAVASECYGTCSFTNISVDEDTVVGPLWGTYDSRNGGIIGMAKSDSKISFTNVDVACRIDAINDVAANYQYWLYRYSGMLIGHVDGVNGVADPTGYVTCDNVTVTYGDWVNYHYCEDADLGAGSYNGPGEYKYARVEAGTGTNGIDLSACNHNADESHNVLIVFDQLFGGGQGVKGLKTYPGVTVNYPD